MQTLLENSSKDVFAEDWRNGGFGLYIHWPYCEAKCPYCDFNSHVSREIDQSRWNRAYLLEIDRAAKAFPDRVLNTVFFGGGTPSLMDPDVVHDLIDAINRNFWLEETEWSIELDPRTMTSVWGEAIAEAGITRASMG
ncbi:MAG: radical SAM protein, partial [Pseudomonadota bacterium]